MGPLTGHYLGIFQNVEIVCFNIFAHHLIILRYI